MMYRERYDDGLFQVSSSSFSWAQSQEKRLYQKVIFCYIKVLISKLKAIVELKQLINVNLYVFFIVL